jgi:endonuclease/exonuclease/phosphatase (EEP) superfamily protein YafD
MLKALRFLGRLGALNCALGCAMATLAGLGGNADLKLDNFNHFAPFWLLGGVVAAALALWLSRGIERRIVLSLSLVAVVLAAERILPEVAQRFAPAAAAQGERLKLIQFNAYKYNVAPGRSVDWLLARDPDIIVIEEGDGLPRAQVMRLRARYPYCNGCPDTGGWFNMILSKRPPLAVGRFEWPHSDSRYYLAGGWSRFSGAGGDFTVVGVHLDWAWGRFSQDQRTGLYDWVRRHPRDRMILLGDFNMTPWSFALARLDRNLGLNRLTHGQASWPGEAYYGMRVPVLPFPYLPIDQVYTGDGWARVRIERGPRIGSDHYPIMVSLAARSKP